LARRLRGDLDTIVLKALRPEPGERYASAEALADDLERHLEGRPVRARPPSLGYSLGRFVRRNRLAVGVSALALAGILAGAGAAVHQARQARAERDVAEEVSAFLEDLLTAPDPFQGGLGPADSVRMVDFIGYADERIRNGLADRPGTRARMLTLLGRVQGNLGRWDRALPTLREAVAANEEHFGSPSPETVAALRSLGFGLAQTGSAAEGDSILRLALQGQVDLTGEGSLETAAIQELLARGLLDARRLDEAEPLLQAAYETQRQRLGDGDPAVAGTLNALAALYSMRGDVEASAAAMEEAIGIMEEAGPAEDANRGIMLGNLAGAYLDLGRLAEADGAATAGLAVLENLLGADHFLTAGAQGQLAALRAAGGRPEEADSLWGTAVATLERTAPTNLGLAVEQGGWARALRAQGRLAEAEERARAAAGAARRIGGPGHPLVGINTGFLADILRDQGRLEEADEAFAAALEALAAAPPADPNALALRVAQARLWGEMGRTEAAEAQLVELQASTEAALGRGHPLERRTAEALIEFYEGQGRSREADRIR
jgi:serine/threonine-protein kinase